MNFLGLDLSFSGTGFYLIRTEENDVSCEIITKPQDFETDIERSDYIAKCIVEQIKDIPLSMIAMEDYFSGKNPGSVIKLAILGTMVRLRLMESGYQYIAFAPTQIKKFESGSGLAPKDTMLKSVFKKHGFDTTSNNIADACAIAYVGKAYYEWQSGRRDFLTYETEVLKKISKERKLVLPYNANLIGKKVSIKKK